MRLRLGQPADCPAIAALHAASWARAYTHILSPDWLAHELIADRDLVWSARFAAPDPALRVVVAHDDAGLAGFVSLFLDANAQWGSHVDNLHVRPDVHGQGLGRRLLAAAAQEALAGAQGRGIDLHVYDANTAARGFYARLGGADGGQWDETAPDGSQQRVHRVWWPDPALLMEPAA